MKGEHAARLIGTVKRASEEARHDLTWGDVSQSAVARMKMTVDPIHWFSTYRVHHRVAEHFGRGRAFLLGDAGHVHSPVGGQGMNTGIGDAINLAWKLAAVVASSARTPACSRATSRSASPSPSGWWPPPTACSPSPARTAHSRGWSGCEAIPRIVPKLMARRTVRRFMFKTISADHGGLPPTSPLSEGRAGAVHGGDRLPWVAPRDAGEPDNFAPLGSLDWQAHVYGEASARSSSNSARASRLPLPRVSVAGRRGRRRAGARRGVSGSAGRVRGPR